MNKKAGMLSQLIGICLSIRILKLELKNCKKKFKMPLKNNRKSIKNKKHNGGPVSRIKSSTFIKDKCFKMNMKN